MERAFYCWNLSKKSGIEGPDLVFWPWVGAGLCGGFDEVPDEDEAVEVCDFEVL